MRVLGLTGGIATGKSSVAHLLRLRGVPVIDADLAARAVVEPGTPTLAAIVDALGPNVLNQDGALDRPALRARIAKEPNTRATLERLTHPAIAQWIQDQLAELERDGHDIAIVDAALMIETGSYAQYEALIVVSSSPEAQLARALARDGSDEDTIRGIIDAQLPLQRKEALADIIIRNDGSMRDLAEAVSVAWSQVSQAPS
ncbi:MAG: dephospho-CoA kinase [Myxococcota bacterium]